MALPKTFAARWLPVRWNGTAAGGATPRKNYPQLCFAPRFDRAQARHHAGSVRTVRAETKGWRVSHLARG